MKPIAGTDLCMVPHVQSEHLRPLFESSPDGVYVRLDETHWACNEKLAGVDGAPQVWIVNESEAIRYQ